MLQRKSKHKKSSKEIPGSYASLTNELYHQYSQTKNNDETGDAKTTVVEPLHSSAKLENMGVEEGKSVDHREVSKPTYTTKVDEYSQTQDQQLQFDNTECNVEQNDFFNNQSTKFKPVEEYIDHISYLSEDENNNDTVIDDTQNSFSDEIQDILLSQANHIDSFELDTRPTNPVSIALDNNETIVELQATNDAKRNTNLSDESGPICVDKKCNDNQNHIAPPIPSEVADDTFKETDEKDGKRKRWFDRRITKLARRLSISNQTKVRIVRVALQFPFSPLSVCKQLLQVKACSSVKLTLCNLYPEKVVNLLVSIIRERNSLFLVRTAQRYLEFI